MIISLFESLIFFLTKQKIDNQAFKNKCEKRLNAEDFLND